MPEVSAVDDDQDAQCKAAALVNELIGEGEDPQQQLEAGRLEAIRGQIVGERDELHGALLSQQERVRRMELRRREALLLLADKNRSNLQRTKAAAHLAHSILASINESIGPVAEQSRAQRVLARHITLLEQLKSLVRNLDLLQTMLEQGSFSGMANILLATQQLAALFGKDCRETPLVGQQLARLAQLQEQMGRRIFDFFRETMKRRGAVPAPQALLLGHAACAIDVLGGTARDQVVRWYCDRQLADYRDSLRSGRELSSLEGISKRLAWLKRLLVLYEAEHAGLFPPRWQVDLELSAEFCAITARDIAEILQAGSARPSSIDLPLLQATVQQTRSFEHVLCQKFGRHHRLGLSRAFEPFLFYFIEAHDRDLGAFRLGLAKRLSLADFDGANVLSSAPELFGLFRDILLDISSLSRGRCLLDLAAVLSKHLVAYSKYIGERIPNKGSVATLKPFELRTLVVIINTCEYCSITTANMVARLHTLLPKALRAELEREGWAQQDFLVQLSVALSRFTQAISRSVESAWGDLLPASETTRGRDQSTCVARVGRTLQESLPMARSVLVNPAHYRVICGRIAAAVGRRFEQAVLDELKAPVSEATAQQLLLDLEALRATIAALLPRHQLPSLSPGEAACRPEEDAIRCIGEETARAECLLKCLTAPAEPVRPFVEGLLLLLPPSVTDPADLLVRLLQMKGVRRTEHERYLQELRRLLPTRPGAAVSPREKKMKFFKLDESLRKLFAAVRLASPPPASNPIPR